ILFYRFLAPPSPTALTLHEAEVGRGDAYGKADAASSGPVVGPTSDNLENEINMAYLGGGELEIDGGESLEVLLDEVCRPCRRLTPHPPPLHGAVEAAVAGCLSIVGATRWEWVIGS
ncbi:hypothetical protein GW17_00053617, partial [Ensete ventricosum]